MNTSSTPLPEDKARAKRELEERVAALRAKLKQIPWTSRNPLDLMPEGDYVSLVIPPIALEIAKVITPEASTNEQNGAVRLIAAALCIVRLYSGADVGTLHDVVALLELAAVPLRQAADILAQPMTPDDGTSAPGG